MKVALIGERDALAQFFLEKMKKEGNDVYFLSENDFYGNFSAAVKYRFFQLSRNPDILKNLFESISPQVVVFTGEEAMNSRLDAWDEEELTLLSRVLGLSAQTKVEKFVYLSSSEVYGEGEAVFEETDRVNPVTTKGMLTAQGEYMVAQFAKRYGIETVIVRASQIYSEQCADDGRDFLSRLIRQVKTESSLPAGEGEVFQPLHVSDLAEALKRIIETGTAHLYNVSGSFTVSAATLCAALKKYFDAAVQLTDSDTKSGTLISNVRLKKELEWTDFKKLTAFFENRQLAYQEHQAKKQEKKGGIPAGVRRVGENVVVFAIFLALYLLTSSHSLFSQINWMLIYVVLISLFYGLRQSALAVILASGAYLATQDLSLLEMTNFYSYAQSVLTVVEFVFFGVAVSYTVDMLREEVRDTRRGYEMVSNDFRELKAINAQNVVIKNEYEKRLLDSKESIPQLYSLIERLMVLSPDRIFLEILHVVAQLVETDTVAVYTVNPKSTYLRLVNALNDASSMGGKSWNIASNAALAAAIARGDLYQGDVWNGEPAVVLPVQYHSKTIAVIVIRSLDYKNCTLYHMNLLKTMGLLVSESMARALDYEQITRQARYVDGSLVLKKEAFQEMVRIAREKQEQGVAEFCILELTTAGNAQAVSERLGSLFRTADHMGTDGEGHYYVLLNNTGTDAVKLVQERLQQKGISSQVSSRFAEAGV